MENSDFNIIDVKKKVSPDLTVERLNDILKNIATEEHVSREKEKVPKKTEEVFLKPIRTWFSRY